MGSNSSQFPTLSAELCPCGHGSESTQRRKHFIKVTVIAKSVPIKRHVHFEEYPGRAGREALRSHAEENQHQP